MEHTVDKHQELVFNNIESLNHVKDLLDSGKVHRSKEALVVTVARVGSSRGNAIALYAGGSCKANSQHQQELLFKMVSARCACTPSSKRGLSVLVGIYCRNPTIARIRHVAPT